MKEIEAKILEVNSPELQKRLADLGADKLFDGTISWVIFDFPDGSLSKQEVLVRLRKKGKETELTLKKLINTEQAKVSEETNIIVSDFESTKKFLEGLGLKQKKGYPLTKHRVSYKLNEVQFEIDTLPQFPTYLEIEGPSFEVLTEYAKKLGYSAEDLKPWGTREVFAYYKNKKN